MKRFLQIAFVMCLYSFSSFAQPSTLTVFSEDGDKFWLILNGEKQNPNAMAKVVVSNQTEPFQKLRIIFEDDKIPTLNQSIQFTDVDQKWNDVSYSIKQKSKGKYVLRISSWKPSKAGANANSGNDRPQTEIEEQIEPQTPKKVNATKNVNTKTTNTSGTSVQVNDPSTGVNFSMNVNMPDMQGVNSTTTTTTTTQTTSTGSQKNMPVASEDVSRPAPKMRPSSSYIPVVKESSVCNLAMSSIEFGDAKKSISSKSFEDTKLQVAKQVAKNNCLNTTQVKEIMALFSFEDSKLDFAKNAYDRTVDKKNYYKVGDAFGFSSSVDELNEYIDKK